MRDWTAFKSERTQIREFIESSLSRDFPSVSQAKIQKGLAQVLMGGKQLRPLLCLLVGRARGVPAQELLSNGVALQCIHCAALLHDDVLDNHQERRGYPTVRALSGDKSALLLGDLMLGLAFDWVHPAGAQILGTCLSRLSRAALAEMSQTSEPPTLDACLRLIDEKTGCLFEAACALASAQEEPDGRQIWLEYGKCVGRLLQIGNDLQDVQLSLEAQRFLGDLADRRATYPLIRAGLEADHWQAYLEGQPLNEVSFLARLEQSLKSTRSDMDSLKEHCRSLVLRSQLADPHLLLELPELIARSN